MKPNDCGQTEIDRLYVLPGAISELKGPSSTDILTSSKTKIGP
jgi:hypothetical protein